MAFVSQRIAMFSFIYRELGGFVSPLTVDEGPLAKHQRNHVIQAPFLQIVQLS